MVVVVMMMMMMMTQTMDGHEDDAA